MTTRSSSIRYYLTTIAPNSRSMYAKLTGIRSSSNMFSAYGHSFSKNSPDHCPAQKDTLRGNDENLTCNCFEIHSRQTAMGFKVDGNRGCCPLLAIVFVADCERPPPRLHAAGSPTASLPTHPIRLAVTLASLHPALDGKLPLCLRRWLSQKRGKEKKIVKRWGIRGDDTPTHEITITSFT